MAKCGCRGEGGYEIVEPNFHSKQPASLIHCPRHAEAHVATLEAQVTALREALDTLIRAGEHHVRCGSVGVCTCDVRLKYSGARAEALAALQEPRG